MCVYLYNWLSTDIYIYIIYISLHIYIVYICIHMNIYTHLCLHVYICIYTVSIPWFSMTKNDLDDFLGLVEATKQSFLGPESILTAREVWLCVSPGEDLVAERRHGGGRADRSYWTKMRTVFDVKSVVIFKGRQVQISIYSCLSS